MVAPLKEFYPLCVWFSRMLITYHNPLTNPRGLKDVGGCLTGWLLFLQKFNLDIECNQEGTIQMLTPDLIFHHRRVLFKSQFISDGTLHSFLKVQVKNPESSKAIEAMKNRVTIPVSAVPVLKKTFLQDGVLCGKFRASCSDSVHTHLVIPESHVKTILEKLHIESF